METKTNLRGWKPAGYRLAVHPTKGVANLSKKDYEQLVKENAPKKITEISNSRQATEISRKMLVDTHKEHFIVHLLNTRNRIILSEIVSIGTINASLVHPRETFRSAVVNRASAIIVAHNHPSGELEASEEDVKVTKRLRDAGEILGIELLDSIVFSEEGYISFKEKGYM